MRDAKPGACRPVEFTSSRQRSVIGSAPPTSISTPPRTTRPPVTGLKNTGIAPAFSASPCSASMKAWLSMMPVTGDSSALVQHRFGSIAIASAARQHAHAFDAVRLGAALDAGEHRVFLGIGRDDQLAAVGVRHALLGAVGVERLARPATQNRAMRLPAG